MKNNSAQGSFKICIIGLGLIGGSMAMALRGFKNAVIVGVDTNAETRKTAIVPEVTIAAIKKFFPAETRKTT